MENYQVATFGGGCFWCVEAIVQRLNGVEKVVSGYAGGKIKNPTYREICSGLTGHAEVIQVTFDPAQITYEELITIFMTSHDPTTMNSQGADHGTQYRSTIMYVNEEQKNIAETVLDLLKENFRNPIVTEIVPLTVFYPAENYHQDYYNQNSELGYCRIVIDPKIKKLRDCFNDKLKSDLI